MGVEDGDPLAGYGILNGPPQGMDAGASFDDDDYDPASRFELRHERRSSPGCHGLICRFDALDNAVAAGQLLVALMPKEFDQDENWYWPPRLEVWERIDQHRIAIHNCEAESDAAEHLCKSLILSNRKINILTARIVDIEEKHRDCDVTVKEIAAGCPW